MTRILLTALLTLASVPSLAQPATPSRSNTIHTFTTQGDHFTLPQASDTILDSPVTNSTTSK